MKQYIDMVKHVLDNGAWKSPVRKNNEGQWEPVDGGVRTLACPNVMFSHDMKDGFPLLTTKKMAWKAIRVELEGFIRGVTDKSWFQERGCKIWDEWANPESVARMKKELEDSHPTNEEYPAKEVQKIANDLGPIYGYQWRHFDEHYSDLGTSPSDEVVTGFSKNPILNGVQYGLSSDQLANIVNTLRTNPMDRRMVCSAWNPNQIHMMALPPCHYAWNVTVIDNKVNLFWAQRSADLMLGVPFNIASYGLLLSLLAEDAGLEVGNLSACFVDCHIYENQIVGAEIQKTREPQPLPTITLNPNYVDYNESNKIDKFNIFKWTYDQVALNDYNPLDKIDFGSVAV